MFSVLINVLGSINVLLLKRVLFVLIVGIKDVVSIDTIIIFVLISCYNYDAQTDTQLV